MQPCRMKSNRRVCPRAPRTRTAGSAALVFLLCLILLSCSSGSAQTSPCNILAELLAKNGSPSGFFYRSDSLPGSDGYLSPALFDALYGDGAFAGRLPLCRSCAIFLGSDKSVLEYAVFEVLMPEDIPEIELMCQRRAAKLEAFARAGTGEEFGVELSLTGSLCVSGRFIILSISG